MSAMQAPMARLVPYSHAAHHAQVRYICKDVYGGTDYLPDNVLRYSQDEEKVVRVLERPESREVLGIVCIERQLDAAFLLGLRVHPQHFGRGIGARLTEAAEAAARDLPGVSSLQTATIQANEAMRAILAKRGWQVQQVMDMWPRDAAAAQRAQLAHPDGSVVSCADGAAAALSSPAALNLVDQWQVCTSLPDLHRHVSRLQEELQPSPLPAAHAARCFVPFYYAPLAVDSSEVAAALKAGHVLVLDEAAGSSMPAAANGHNTARDSSSTDAADVASEIPADQRAANGFGPGPGSSQHGDTCLQHSGHRGVIVITPLVPTAAGKPQQPVACIMGSSAAVVESALLRAVRISPFFVACMTRPQQQALPLYRATPTHEWYCLIFSKDL